MRKILSIASYAILVFAFGYMSWQVGRAYAESENIKTTDCTVYVELIDELINPSIAVEINARYKERENH